MQLPCCLGASVLHHCMMSMRVVWRVADSDTMWPLDILPQVWRPWHVAYYERQYVSPTANCIRHHRYMQSCRAWSPSLFDRDALLSLIPQASTQAAIPVLLRKTQELHLTSSGGRDSCEQVVQQDARRDGHVQAVHAERRLALAALGRRRNAGTSCAGTQVASCIPICAIICLSVQLCARRWPAVAQTDMWRSSNVLYRPLGQAHALNNSCF